MLEAFHVLPMTVAIGISTGANTLSGSVRECDLIAPHKTPTANCVEGEVALSAYECRFFVVRTKSGFIFLHHVWSGFTLIEGDRVIGPLHTPGIHELVVLYEMTIDVEVESDTTDSMIAQKTFYRRCHHETAPLAG